MKSRPNIGPHGDVPNIRETFENLLPILDQHGVDARNVRRQTYSKFLDDWKANRLESYEPSSVTQLMREVLEVVFVLDTFTNNSFPIPTRLVQAAFGGGPLTLNDPEADRARNFMLELRVAIYFLRFGFAVLLDQDCDVIAERGGKRFFIECKRLYSENKVQNRVKEAFSQLAKRLNSADPDHDNRGIAWFDPTPIILRYCPFYMAATKLAALQAARVDLLEFQRRNIDLRAAPNDARVIALVFQMVFPSRCSLDESLMTGFTSLVLPGNPSLTDDDERFVTKLFDDLFELDGPVN